MAHQLPGAASSFSGSSDIPEGQVRDLCATAVGQHLRSGLHQQPGWDGVPQLTSLARYLWLWALQRDISLTAQHIPGVSNLAADTESRDRTDWKLSPAVFNKINQIFGPLEVDLFASRLTYQLPRYFSWRPDPSAEATDAFQHDWAPLKGFANPPWCLIGRVLNQVMIQKAQVILVAPIWKGQPWYPVLLNMFWEFPQRIPPHPNLIQSPGSPKVNPPASRMAYLREKLSGSSLSEEASRLFLASWRAKSNQSYDSHFRKWISWCSERGSNPVSGPIAEVANFLADLYEQGYQSRSLNTFRSAISSVHDRVDGVEVGKHPMVTRLLKGAFHDRPPLPRYIATWNVQSVLDYLEGLGKKIPHCHLNSYLISYVCYWH